MGSIPLFPEAASSFARDVDYLYFFIVAVCAFFAIGIVLAVFYFAIRYRRRHENEVGRPVAGGLALEITWTVIPLGLVMVMFAWGAQVFMTIARPPDDAIQMYVTGKQWMWKIQHPTGQREINEMHVPVGKNIKLTLTSEDVIHDFYVPAFRTKTDVLPGRYSTMWFRATKPGKYHLFCAEYCGTKHSGMIGSVYVMEPGDYQAWLSGGSGEGSMAQRGQKLFEDLACNNCHKVNEGEQGRCPNLRNLFGSQVKLANGQGIKADEAYLRESILNPNAKLVEGYQPVMPTFEGLVTEDGILQLIEYIKSVGPKQPTGDTKKGAPGPVTPSIANTEKKVR